MADESKRNYETVTFMKFRETKLLLNKLRRSDKLYNWRKYCQSYYCEKDFGNELKKVHERSSWNWALDNFEIKGQLRETPRQVSSTIILAFILVHHLYQRNKYFLIDYLDINDFTALFLWA